MSKALIVDDHPFIRATVKYLLRQEGFDKIFEAGNGADALQIARSSGLTCSFWTWRCPSWAGWR